MNLIEYKIELNLDCQAVVVDIQSPDFEQRVKILKQRCLKEFHASERNIAIDDEVINFIANELKLSVREMIGAEFVGMILLIVYVGAVAVLFLFVVMMLEGNFVKRGRVAASAAYLFRFHCLCSLCLHSGCAALPRLSPHPPR